MRHYFSLMKPGIVIGNILTTLAGFLLASKGKVDWSLLIATIFGLSLIMAAACVFNNYIDREMDKKMVRTQKRALAANTISKKKALTFGLFLAFFGFLLLEIFTNPVALFVAALGFLTYVFFYSFLKTTSSYGTAIGSVAGAVPPVVGYSAVTHQLDLGAYILFSMLVLWQMPHFFAIAIYHLNDYQAAKIPVLPVAKGIYSTKVRMLVYILVFVLVSMALTFFEYTGFLYLGVLLSLGTGWLLLAFQGFTTNNDRLWGRNMLRFSLVVITLLSFVIPFDFVK